MSEESRDIFGEELGIIIDKAEPGQVIAHLSIAEKHLNQHGTAHGGVIFTLADAVFARASNIHGIPAVALDTSMTFIRAARSGETLYAYCQEAALRRRVAVYTVEIKSQDQLVALFRGTVFRIPPEGETKAGTHN
ncbi:MAG: phenylacetic acid degradation protein PaaD [Sulfobacillus benefaciens]|uniref:Phenylacetic acid degradation protein PaaD n=1 Tax=Sulfobacillus benefaciens TaxID=453960 RepID=A0A2T2XFD8_9FIRM|nr:MAG: phenylacetic acid degradation protein PaaD [Sulfobacillus benefaciens]